MEKITDSIGKPIRSLQTMLRLVAQREKEIPSVIPDGIYGKQTMQAVSALQKSANLPITGIVDFATWKALVKKYRAARIYRLPAQTLAPDFQPEQIIQKGEKNHHLFLVQGMLLALSQIYQNLPAPQVTGTLDEDSAKALQFLQEKSGLPATGELDRATWHILAKLYRLAIQDGTVSPTPPSPQASDVQSQSAKSQESPNQDTQARES